MGGKIFPDLSVLASTLAKNYNIESIRFKTQYFTYIDIRLFQAYE